MVLSSESQPGHFAPNYTPFEISGSTEDPDIRARLEQYQVFLAILNDEKRWNDFSVIDHRNLARKLGTKGQLNGSHHHQLAKEIKLKYEDSKGVVRTCAFTLLLDATKNESLTQVFATISHPDIERVFREQLGYQLLEHIDSVYSLGNDSLETRLLCFSSTELEEISQQHQGFSINLIPRIIRLQLHNLYSIILKHAPYYPSLTFQYLLDRYFFQHESASERPTRILLTKSFAAILKSRGFSWQDLDHPDIPRNEREQYLTISDDDTLTLALLQSGVLLDTGKTIVDETYVEELKRELEAKDQLIKQAQMVQLTMPKILNDVFSVFLENKSVDNYLWIPDNFELDEEQRDEVEQHLQIISQSSYQTQISTYERELTDYWLKLARDEYNNPKVQERLRLIEIIDIDDFVRETQLRFAARHKEITQQNQIAVMDYMLRNMTPTLLMRGTINTTQLIRNRPDQVQTVLSYVYNFLKSTRGKSRKKIWLPSPYPMGTLVHLMQYAATQSQSKTLDPKIKYKYAMVKEILGHLYEVEQSKL